MAKSPSFSGIEYWFKHSTEKTSTVASSIRMESCGYCEEFYYDKGM